MIIHTLEDVFHRLLQCTTPKQLEEVLSKIGNHPNIGLNNLMDFGLSWQPYGGKTSNYSTIGLATKPGRSLTERITNAIDAVLESHAARTSAKPSSPHVAANEWFGRPFSTFESGLYTWKYSNGGFDRKVAVVLNPSDTKEAPTIDVLDHGVGIRPEAFPSTILSLQEGNKITKKYLVGAFGQGGSSTLAFCDFALVVSCAPDDHGTVSFTVIREINMGEDYKENCYAYLALKSEGGALTVPHFVTKGQIELYPKTERLRMSTLNQGTLVRHFSFRLTNIYKELSPSEGNLYHYLHCSMFDPIIPFQIIDRRGQIPKQEVVTGSRNRLMRLVAKKEKLAEDEIDKSNTQVELYHPVTYIKPFGADTTCIKVEYWVALNYKKKKDKVTGDEIMSLRSDSHELFVQKRHLAVVTLNGQNQGELTYSQLLKDLGLDSVARHLIIHIDVTEAPANIKRLLFSTNRESLKDGDVLNSIKDEIRRILSEDEKLLEIERVLEEKAIKEVRETTDDEVKKQITRLLSDAGFTPSAEGEVLRRSPDGTGESSQPSHGNGWRTPKPVMPIDILKYPDVTRFDIVYPEEDLRLRVEGTAMLRIETDADSRYDDQIRIKFDPSDSVEIASRFPLNGGRAWWRLKPAEGAEVGQRGKVVVTLTKPNGDQLKAEIAFEIIEALDKPANLQRGKIPDFEVLPITPGDDDRWRDLWPNNFDEENDITSVAYTATQVGTKTIVYYSTVFNDFHAMCEKLKRENPVLYGFFETHYKVWIGYHAILQMKAGQDPGDNEELAQEQERERTRVARMQVRQALESAKMSLQVQKNKALTAADA